MLHYISLSIEYITLSIEYITLSIEVYATCHTAFEQTKHESPRSRQATPEYKVKIPGKLKRVIGFYYLEIFHDIEKEVRYFFPLSIILVSLPSLMLTLSFSITTITLYFGLFFDSIIYTLILLFLLLFSFINIKGSSLYSRTKSSIYMNPVYIQGLN
jgi:hypothetical protein